MRHLTSRLTAFPAVALAAGPALVFLGSATPALLSTGPWRALAAGRLTTLFLRSITLGLLTAALSAALGAGAALWLASGSGPLRAAGLALLPLPVLLPHPVLALAAASVLGAAAPTGGPGAVLVSAAVLASSWFPVVAGVALVELSALPVQLLEASSLSAGPERTWTRGILPVLVFPVAAAGAFAGCAALGDYGVPATFQLPVWATELYSALSLGAGAGRVATLSLPLLVPMVILLPLLARSMARLPAPGRGAGLGTLPPAPAWLRRVTAIPAALALLLPLEVLTILILEAGTPSRVTAALRTGGDSLVASAVLAAAAGTLVAACVLPAAFEILHRPSPALLAACLLPVLLPAPLHGLGAVGALRSLPPFAALVAAVAGRVLPYALVVALLLLRQRDPLLLDAARLTPGTLRRSWLGLRLGAPALVAAGAVAAALAHGELGVTVLLAPPGAPLFPVKLFNLLHYGASDVAAGLALGALPVPLLAWAALVLAWRFA